jgi:hypothetical protein
MSNPEIHHQWNWARFVGYIEKNSWLLGKMSESGFPDASGREEG